MAGKKKKGLRFVLDHDPGPGQLRGRVVQEGGVLSIYVDGYNHPAPVAGLAFQDGSLKLIVFDTPNPDEHKEVDLEAVKD
jgi:hypothetical protein